MRQHGSSARAAGIGAIYSQGRTPMEYLDLDIEVRSGKKEDPPVME
jgi:hypothetical protein